MESVNEAPYERRVLTEFLFSEEKKSVTDTHRCLRSVLWGAAFDKGTVSRSAARNRKSRAV
jgi:hypothetical protein